MDNDLELESFDLDELILCLNHAPQDVDEVVFGLPLHNDEFMIKAKDLIETYVANHPDYYYIGS